MRQHPKLHWSAYLWPGLPHVWLRGSWAGLALAVGFTALGNILLATTFVWTEWLSLRARCVVSSALALIWVVSWIEARADWRRLLAELSAGAAGPADPAVRSDQLFRSAQAAYLGRDWVSAEQTLLKLLRHDARDAEARLMLASLWIRQGQYAAASQQLDRLEMLETAAAWRREIAIERERISTASVMNMPDQTPAPAEPERTAIAPIERRNAA